EACADEITLAGLALFDEGYVLGVQQHEGLPGLERREERVEKCKLVSLVLDPGARELHQLPCAVLEALVDLDVPLLGVAAVLIDHDPTERRDLEAVGRHPLWGRGEMRVR